MDAPTRADWDAWRAERLEAVRAVPGNLALVAYQPVSPEPTPVERIAGATVRQSDDGAGVMLTAQAELGVTVDGTPVAAEVFVGDTYGDTPNLIRHGRYTIDVFSVDGTDHELRIYDEDAPNLADFDSIEVYDFDPELAVRGRFEAFDDVDQVAWEFSRADDTGRRKQVPGVIHVPLGGVDRQLAAFLDGAALVLVFADGTTGESYAPGRFLKLDLPDESGEVTVDFNRAFVPPCGFSDYYSCPLPPPQNRLDVPIRAGEMRVTWKTPRD